MDGHASAYTQQHQQGQQQHQQPFLQQMPAYSGAQAAQAHSMVLGHPVPLQAPSHAAQQWQRPQHGHTITTGAPTAVLATGVTIPQGPFHPFVQAMRSAPMPQLQQQQMTYPPPPGMAAGQPMVQQMQLPRQQLQQQQVAYPPPPGTAAGQPMTQQPQMQRPQQQPQQQMYPQRQQQQQQQQHLQQQQQQPQQRTSQASSSNLFMIMQQGLEAMIQKLDNDHPHVKVPAHVSRPGQAQPTAATAAPQQQQRQQQQQQQQQQQGLSRSVTAPPGFGSAQQRGSSAAPTAAAAPKRSFSETISTPHASTSQQPAAAPSAPQRRSEQLTRDIPQLPPGFPPPSKRVDVRKLNPRELRTLASQHNAKHQALDPIDEVLRGIPESAKIRQGTVPAVAFSLGGVPDDNPYYKAWKSVKYRSKVGKPAAAAEAAREKQQREQQRQAQPPLNRNGSGGSGSLPTPKPPSAAQTAAQTAAAVPGAPPAKRQHRTQALLTPDQEAFHAKLAAYLERRVEVPLLAKGAPPLDLKALWLEVMGQNGAAAVTRANGWRHIALSLQRDASLASELALVYDCYLHPLEQHMPPTQRPARAMDWMEKLIQQRSAVAKAAASGGQVVAAAAKALQADQAHANWQNERPGKMLPLAPVLAIQVLRDAARNPSAVAKECIKLELPELVALREAKQGAGQGAAGAAADVAAADGVAGGSSNAAGTATANVTAAPAAAGQPGQGPSAGPSSSKHHMQAEGPSANTGGPSTASPNINVLVMEAARRLVVSARQVASGPPGCTKPPYIPAHAREPDGTGAAAPLRGAAQLAWTPVQPTAALPPLVPVQLQRRRSSDDGFSPTGGSGKGGGGGGKGMRTFLGRTPKCGACKCCLNPSMKKACSVNRERMQQGLEPILEAK